MYQVGDQVSDQVGWIRNLYALHHDDWTGRGMDYLHSDTGGLSGQSSGGRIVVAAPFLRKRHLFTIGIRPSVAPHGTIACPISEIPVGGIAESSARTDTDGRGKGWDT